MAVSFKGDVAGLQDVGAMGQSQGQAGVLLHQQDGETIATDGWTWILATNG